MNETPRASGASKIILIGLGVIIALLGLLWLPAASNSPAWAVPGTS